MIDFLLSPTTWESLRILGSVVLVFVAAWGLLHATDGRLAIAGPLRAGEISRRRVTMGVLLAIGVLFCAQSVVAVGTPDTSLTLAVVLVNVSILFTVTSLAVLSLQTSAAWAEQQELTIAEPLTPTVAELLNSISGSGRRAVHAGLNDLAIITGCLDLMAHGGELTPERQVDLNDALVGVAQLRGHMDIVQKLMRGIGDDDLPLLDPPIAPEQEV